MTVDPVLSSVLESLEAEGDNVLLCWGNSWFCSGLPDSSSAAVTPDILQICILSVGSVPACPAEWKSRMCSGPGVLEQIHTLDQKWEKRRKNL